LRLLLRVDLAEEIERLGVLRVVVLEATEPGLDVTAVIRSDGRLVGARHLALRAIQLGGCVLATRGDKKQEGSDRGKATHAGHLAHSERT
jgi:hypothetical protein